MTTLENIVLRECDYGYAKEISVAQKIKLRDASYAAISVIYSTSSKDSTSTVTKEDIITDIKEVMILLPIEEVTKILGRVETEGSKALKVKPPMYENISNKGLHVKSMDKEIESPMQQPISMEQITAESADEIVQKMLSQEETDEENVRISRNGAAMAKVEKYIEMSPNEENKENGIIPPTVIEEQNARPVSREVPVVVPERNSESEEKELESTQDFTLDPEKITSVIVDLGQLREYLAKTAELKKAAQQAKEEEIQAKAAAERAERETASTRDELRKTAEEFAAHQQSLIAQAEESQAQAHLYDTKRDECLAEQAEYREAISDMLAVMGTSTNNPKERVM